VDKEGFLTTGAVVVTVDKEELLTTLMKAAEDLWSVSVHVIRVFAVVMQSPSL